MTSSEPGLTATDGQDAGPARPGRAKTTLLAALIGVGLLVTPIWLAFLLWLVYRAALWLAG